jgi:6-phosphogluconolactonase (cycloisomerase 2 family)
MIIRRAAIAAALVLAPGLASAGNLILSANDGKQPMVNGAYQVADPPAPDTLAVIDASVWPPKLKAEIEVQHSVAAPPSAVALSPDEKLALVGAPNKVDPKDKTKTVVEKFVQVVDLEAQPPAVSDKVEVPHQPIGVAFSKDGKLALAAHFEGKVTLLKIDGKKVSVAETLTIGDDKSRVSTVAFTPDGKWALATKRGENTVAVLQVEGGKVTYTKRDITVGTQPYGMDISVDGKWAAVANIGRGTGDADSVTLIDLKANPVRAVETFGVPQTPEGIAISPNGEFLAVGCINGTNKAKDSPFYNAQGKLLLYAVRDGKVEKLGEADTGTNTQGVAFTADSKHLLVQNYGEKQIGIFRVSGAGLEASKQEAIALKAAPAAIRIAP